MSTILIPSDILRETKRHFGKLRQRRMTLPVLSHILLTAGYDDWNKRGQLTLTHRDGDGHSAVLQIPVEIHGWPPIIAFNPVYLAQALEIGSTLCLSDEMSPGICRHPNGRLCVLMPMRVTIPAAA